MPFQSSARKALREGLGTATTKWQRRLVHTTPREETSARVNVVSYVLSPEEKVNSHWQISVLSFKYPVDLRRLL